MALSQSLSTGITGLISHQTAMDNIGNNLANVNTSGFKQGVYQFSNLLHQSIKGGMAADASTGRGSVNPISLGLGTQTASINKVFTQGNIETTENPYDFAINGNGFFVVRSGNAYAYTRAGSFYRGQDGCLMSEAGGGLYVQGTMAVRQSDGTYRIPADAKMENIVIPIGSVGGHSQTTTVAYTGNLKSSDEIATGLNLFGTTAYPTTDNIQSWMSSDFNGGDNAKADNTWNALEESSYIISQARYDAIVAAGGTVPDTVKVSASAVDLSVAERYADSLIVNYQTTDADGVVSDHSQAISITALVAQYNNAVPDEEKIASPVRVGANPDDPEEQTLEDVMTLLNGFLADPANSELIPLDVADGSVISGLTSVDGVVEVLKTINGGNVQTSASFARTEYDENGRATGNLIAADLDTDLKDIWYLKGNTWVQAFANIKNGDDITISFAKGEGQIESTFTYNEPKDGPIIAGQTGVDQERSHTLEHFLTFLGGDVDDPSVVCQNVSPAMFGYREGLNEDEWDSAGYLAALGDTSLATSDENTDMVGGAMGLLSLGPRISDAEGGRDSYSTPVESGGVYTRTGLSQVDYTYVDPTTGETTTRKADSFNVSFVSNLGEMNALENISISFNDVPHDAMFDQELSYSEPQGASSTLTVDYYDSLGNARTATIRMAMVEQDDNFTTWRWYADSTDDSDFGWTTDVNGNITTNLSVGTGLIRFDKDGNYVSGSEYSETNGITIDLNNQGVNNPIWIKVLNGLSSSSTQALDFSGMTCNAAASDFKLKEQNGAPPGQLTEFAVDGNGVIQGLYNNGNVVEIARIGMAQVPNETGMMTADGNIFYTSAASGDALYGHAGTGGLGSIVQNSLEASNVELAVEFTKLITIERGYQANSRIITTADEMIQELLNLKR